MLLCQGVENRSCPPAFAPQCILASAHDFLSSDRRKILKRSRSQLATECGRTAEQRRDISAGVMAKIRGHLQRPTAKALKELGLPDNVGRLSQEASLGRCQAWSSKPACGISCVAVGSTPTSFRQAKQNAGLLFTPGEVEDHHVQRLLGISCESALLHVFHSLSPVENLTRFASMLPKK